MKNNIFTIFLLGTSTQDGGKKERSDVHEHLLDPNILNNI